MSFDAIVAGDAVFLDADVLVYHFAGRPQFGAACTRLIERIEQQEIRGFASSRCVADLAHRLMTIEAIHLLGWPVAGIAARLRRHHSEISKLSRHAQAVSQLAGLRIQVLPVSESLVIEATRLGPRHELLTGDALIVAMMQQHGLDKLASVDSDFDRVPGLTRYSTS